MFQLKFCLKTFETFFLLYVSSVRKRSILAIILLKINKYCRSSARVADMVREGEEG